MREGGGGGKEEEGLSFASRMHMPVVIPEGGGQLHVRVCRNIASEQCRMLSCVGGGGEGEANVWKGQSFAGAIPHR